MDLLNQILEHVFGHDFIKPSEASNVKCNFGPFFNVINAHLKSQTHQCSRVQNEETVSKEDSEDGRVGNKKVSLDLELSNRISSSDSFKIIGVSHFGSVKTNCGVFKGRWQYEVTLLSSGIMQIGWATFTSKFGLGQGIGDTADSYSFDGSRVCKWNVVAEDYGEKWEENDVIGCCIDLNDASIKFYRNGRSMGLAFREIEVGAGIVYFPAVSLKQKEGLIANFGSTPFFYPVPGFCPIQDPPHLQLASVTYLLECTNKLLTLMDRRTAVGQLKMPGKACDGLPISHDAVCMEVGKILVSNITPFLTNPFIVEVKLIPFIRGLNDPENVSGGQSKTRPSARIASPKNTAGATNNWKLNTFLDIMLAFSGRGDLKEWSNVLITRLSSKFQHTIRPLVYEFSQQKDAIMVLHNLVRHRKLRHYLMNHILFEEIIFPCFMNINVPFVESNLWETESLVEINKRAVFASVSRMKSAIKGLEDMQIELLLSLLDNTDGLSTGPSSRCIFLGKFRMLRRQFYALYRVDPHKSPGSPLFLVQPFLLRLLRVLEFLWTQEVGSSEQASIPPCKFYDGSISYYDADRLGGVLLYLLKTFFKDLEQRVEPSQASGVSEVGATNGGSQSIVESSTSTGEAVLSNFDSPDVSARVFDMFEDILQIEPWSDQQETPSNDLDKHCVKGPLDSLSFLTELLDGLVLLYHISTKICLPEKNMSNQQNRVNQLVGALNDNKEAMKRFNTSHEKQHSETVKALELSESVLLEHLHNVTAHVTIQEATRFPNRLSWLFKAVQRTMKASSEDERLFSFVPDFYLECLVDILKDLSSETKSYPVPMEDTLDRDQLLQDVVQFICDHIDDQRVRIAKAKDTLLLTLLEIVTSQNLLEVLHMVPDNSRLNMIRFLLQPYENRAWANSNLILVQIWHGSPGAFACGGNLSTFHRYKLRPATVSYPINPLSIESDPSPSPVLQEQIKIILMSDTDVATSFLNSILNQLNWAFSEFIGMLQELQNVSNRRERVLVESRQLKICATCFDLTLALLRVLEMVSSLALPVFVRLDQPNSLFLLARLCQLICQVLNRASSQDGCFHHITTLQIPGLENVDHLPILAAVCGILLAILKDDLLNFADSSDTEVPIVSKTLLMEPSFQLSSLTFLLGGSSNFFSLNLYKEYITSEEVDQVERMIKMLTHYHDIVTNTNAALKAVDEDEICTICFAFPISTTFEPCKHHSCQACITHHLMNCVTCFFCKAVISTVVDEKGDIIYNIEQANPLLPVGNSGSER